MSATESTRHLIEQHIDNVCKWNLAALAEDYAPDAVMLFPQGCAHGRDAIMAAYTNAPRVGGLLVDARTYDGANAVITYRSDSFRFATDSFVVRDGRIVAQTVVVMPDPARAVAQQWIERLQSENPVDAMVLLDADVRYEIIGGTPMSGVYDGRDDVLNRLVASMGAFPSPPRVRCEAIVADGDRAVILGSGVGEGPYGRYDQSHYAWSMRVAAGQIVELVEFLDTALLEVAAFGSKLVRRGEAQ